MKKRVIKDISVVFIISIIAKIIAFLKTVIQASHFGSNIHTDSYNMAWGVVNNILYMITTAISVAFIPVYVKKKSNDGILETKKFATKIITFMLLLAFCVVLALELLANPIMCIFAPGYEGVILDETVSYFRFLTLGFIFALVSSLYENMLNAERVYGYSSISSVINSIVLITVIVLFSDRLQIWALVIAVPLSFICQFLILYMRGKVYGRISLQYGLKDAAIKQILYQSVPVLISQASVEINQAVDRALLSNVEEGAVTSVSYSATLYQFVSGIIVIPISTVLFTELSEAGVNRNIKEMQILLSRCFKVTALICIPIMIVTECTSVDIVSIVYGHGKFDINASRQTAEGLLAYILCLLPVTIKSVLSRAYYSLNDTKTPMLVGIFEVAINIALSILLVRYLGILGVVGATSIASVVGTASLLLIFKKKYTMETRWSGGREYVHILLAGISASIIAWLVKDLLVFNTLFDFIIKALIIIFIFVLILLVCRDALFLSILRYIRYILNKIREKCYSMH